MLDLASKKLFVSSFHISSPTPEHRTDRLESQDGVIYFGSNIKERKLSAKIFVEADNYLDFDLLRDEIFTIFNPLEPFYIIRDLQPDKRMFVSVSSDFDVDYLDWDTGEFEIDFVMYSGYVESNEQKKVINQTNKFKITNDGHIPINPSNRALVITYVGAGDNLTIMNKTTGEKFMLNGVLKTTDTVRIDGLSVKKNNLSVFRNTNKQFISLAKGENDIEVVGATGAYTVTFEYRSYYL
nr:phage tail family protein [Priestia taiwanensis]